MSEIDLSLLSDFIVEAREHLEEMESELLKLEGDRGSNEILNNIFRPIHTIKGASQFVGLDKVSALSHRMEDLLDLCRNGQQVVTSEVIDLLISGRDRIIDLVEELEASQVEQSNVEDLVERLVFLMEGGSSTSEPELPSDPIESEQASEPSPSPSSETEFEESGDQELFEVFTSQLSEKIALLRGMAGRLSGGGDDFTLVGLASEAVNALHSSANYMGYTELTELYSHWLETLDGAMRDISMGKQVEKKIFTEFLDQIAELFPETADLSISDAQLSLLLEDDGEDEETDDSSPFGDLPDDLLQAAGFMDMESEESAEVPAPNAAPIAEAVEEEEVSDEIDMSLLNDFIIEAEEHLEDMENQLLKLNENPGATEILDDIFRPIHTIKGASQFVGLKRVASLSHRFEDLLDLLRNGEITNTSEITELLMKGRDRIVKLIDDLEHFQNEMTPVKDMIAIVSSVIENGGMVSDSVQKSPPATIEEKSEQAEDEVFSSAELPEDAPEVGEPGSPAATVPATSAPMSAHSPDVIVEDEYDSELFSIFINQLVEKGSTIRILIDQIEHNADASATLSAIAEQITALKSAANYMGYEKPVELYKHWLEQIGASQKAIANHQTPDFGYMHECLLTLSSYFPQLESGGSGQVQMAPTQQQKKPTSIASTSPATPQVTESSGPVSAETQQNAVTDGSDLYIRLNEALDGSVIPALEEDYDSLSEVFDEMLSSLPDVSFAPAAASDHKPRTSKSKDPVAKADELSQSIRQLNDMDSPKAKPAPVQQPKPTATEPVVNTLSADNSPSDKPSGERDKQNNDTPAPAKKREGGNEKLIKKSVRVDAEKIDTLMNQVGELIVDRSYFFTLYNDMRGLQQHLKEELNLDQKEMKVLRAFTYRLGEAIASLSRTSNELQEGVMKVRMLPISQLFNRYPRLIHDLTHNTDKQVKLDIRGEETELDKMIVEELSDPLIHIIRNSVDHGIENKEDRLRSGKPETATLILEAYQESNHIVIEVTDDGRGIDFDRVREKAVERGLAKADDVGNMTQRELIRMIMAPGFSTAAAITKTSGRGVGMDVVKKNIEKLNGTIEIDSKPGTMTQIRLKIPLTLAIIAALLVRVGKGSFTIPLSNVEETLRIYEADTSTIEGTEVIHLRGRTLPIFRLSNLFNLESDDHAGEDKSFVVIVNTGSEQIGLVVDELMGQDEVVIKPLVDYLQEQSGFSGATIIGDGRISLILDIYELVNMSASKQALRLQKFAHRRQYGSKMESDGTSGAKDKSPTVH